MKNLLVNALLVLATLVAPLPAFALDSADFELIARPAYVEMTREAPLAYGDKKYDVAFTKYQRLACAGDKAAQAALGGMYLSGLGVERDDLTGYVWLKLASEFDFPAYQVVVKQIEAKLTPEQLAFTKARAERLRADYGLRVTNMSCNTSSSAWYSSNMKDIVVCRPQTQVRQFLVHRCVESR